MAAEGATLTDDAHISFAKRLAHNNKDTRKAALKKVKRWLVTKSKQGALDHDEIIKIWKGLHYSMWYSDKPLTQESLALDISQIVSLLPDMGDAINFFGGFCETIAREWAGIDRQRLDKFYMFIKTALKCVLEFCAANDWKEEIVKNVVETLDIRIINSQCPDSISVFISEHLYTLYTEVCTDSTSPFFITELLSCYVTVLSKTPKKDLSQVLMSNLFTPIISNSVNVKIDHIRLIDHITNVAVQPGILTRNRKLLYRLRNDVATVGGVNVVISSPLGKHSLVKEGDENVPDNGISEEEAVKPPKKKKKKKKKQVVEQSETAVENGDIKTEEISDVTDQIVDSKPSTKTEEEICEPVPVTPEVAEPASPEENESNVKVEGEAAEDTKVETKEPVSVEDSVAVEEPITTEEAVSVDGTDVKEESESPKEETESVPIEDRSTDSKEDIAIVEEPESTEKEVAREEKEDKKVEEEKKEEEKKEEEKKEEVAETESKEEVAEEVTDKETKEEVGVQKDTSDNKEDLVEEAAETAETEETEETAVLAPTESEISEEVVKTEEVKSKEIISSTPATKTGKRKSTRTKKTPKKVAEAEPAPASEATESVENDKPAEETEPEVSSLPEETTEAARSPKQTRSLRKRKKKSICATPEVTAPSTPTVSTSTKKKVRLSMENNQTFFFKKNTSLESPKPYDSTRTPVKGVLKVSPALTRSQARKKGKSRVKP